MNVDRPARALLDLWLIPLLLALAALTLHLACGEHYGFFRDEFYFIACGRRLDWGYVDQPAVIAIISRFALWLSHDGASVELFRLPGYLAGASTILVSAMLARRLGAGRFGVALAAAVTFGCPLLLAQSHLMAMNVFEILTWSAIALVSTWAVAGYEPAWLALGVLLGLALATKYSAGLLSLGLLVALLSSRSRRYLASPWLWAGLVFTVLLAFPSLYWQYRHGFPFAELLENGRRYKNLPIPRLTVLLHALLEQGLFGGLLSLVGAVFLLSSDDRRRYVGVTFVFVVVCFCLLGAKPYYLGPAFPPLFVGGAVLVERRLRSPLMRRIVFALPVLLVIPVAPLTVPLLPTPTMALNWMHVLGVHSEQLERKATQEMPQHFADQSGWPERVAAVTAVVRSFSAEDRAHTVIYCTNYGDAGALELLGRDLPPVICSHNQYFLWGVPGDPKIVLALGGPLEVYQELFGSVTPCGHTPVIPEGMASESDIPMYCCRDPRVPIEQLLVRTRHYD